MKPLTINARGLFCYNFAAFRVLIDGRLLRDPNRDVCGLGESIARAAMAISPSVEHKTGHPACVRPDVGLIMSGDTAYYVSVHSIVGLN